MKKHIQRLLFATLAILLGGANSAWAVEVTETYDFGGFITTNGAPSMSLGSTVVATQSGTSTYTGGDLYLLNNPTSNEQTLQLNERFAIDYGANAKQQIRFMWRSSSNAYQHGLAGNWYGNGAANTACHLSVLSLKTGDKITFTYAIQSGKAAQPYLCASNVVAGVDADAYLASGTQYTIAKDGNLDIYFKNNNFAVSKIVIVTEKQGEEEMGKPSISITGVNGTSRIITITPGEGEAGSDATATYYTLDGSDPSDSQNEERIQYTEPFAISTTTTVKAVSFLNTKASEIESKEIEAGTTISLNALSYALSDITDGEGKTYIVNSDNSTILLKPTIEYSYVFTPLDGSSPINGNGATISVDKLGTIVVTASATGYESVQTTIINDTKYVAGSSLSLKAADVLAEDDAAWSYNSEGTRYANWSGYNGVSRANYPYWTPATDGKGTIGDFSFEPGENVLMRTVGFIHNTNIRNLKVTNLPKNTIVKFVVSTYSANPFNVFVEAIDGVATYGIGAGSSGFAVESIQLYTKDIYTVDFNTAITTSNHDFRVASNWKHIVHRYNDGYSDYYMSYSYGADTGIESSGALYAGQQRAGDNSDNETTYDFLVTPIVSGEITIYAKKSSSGSPFVEFWSLNETGTAKDTKLYEVTSFESDTWTAVTYNVTTPQRIGIRAQYVYLDNFSAVEATIEPEKSIAIATADPTATTGTIYWEQQANGKVLVKYTVTVTNNGEVNLTQGMDNYSISVFNRKTNEVYFTVPVPQDLAIGATSDPFEVSGEVETTIWPNNYSYINMDLKENLQGSTIQRTQSHYTAYEPKFVFRAAESSSTSSITAAEAWGTITESTTKSFEIANTGTAPLTIKSITLPEGFTSDNAPTEEFILAKGETQILNITQDATAQGTFAGNLTIVYLDKNAAEQTYSLAFSATVIGANTWTADFNNSTSTVVYPVGSIAEGGISKDYQFISSGNYNNWLVGYNTTSYATGNNKFITPKLHANAGDKLAFDVKAGYSSSDNYFVKVYVSADRQNWGEPVETYVYSTVGSSFTTKTISFDEAGDYYVGFALYGTGSGIDNIVGLEKVAVAHDLYIKSVSWPDASIKSGSAQSKPTIDIIPLTDEAADAYTVKYVCGETVLAEATSTALTASANSSKTFTFNWTPSVENTTVYEDTKIVFDFGGDVTFESETFDLTVTNEPKFHFVGSIPSSKWYEPTDVSTPIAFGKTNQADSKTFYVYNWGSAPLTVKSIAVPAGFTATPAEQFEVVAFDENNMSAAAQAVEITFSATEAGTYSGNLVVTYVNGAGEDATFELAISGTKLDLSKYYANFNDQEWPAGSVYQDNVSISYIATGDYGLLSSSSTKNLFITPKLTATEGEILQFDASTRNSYYDGTVKVYLSTDRETWGDPVKEIELSKTENTSKATYEYTFTTSGKYYVAFELSEARVDDIYGLTLAAVAHDMKIASSSIPAEGMQNINTTATVNVLNFGLADDNATVTVYLDGEAVATSEAQAIPMNHKLSDAGTQFSINFHSPKAGTFPVSLEVKNGDYTLTTDPVNVVFAEEQAKSDADMAVNGTTGEVPLNLNYKNSESVTMYNAAALAAAGITPGAVIKKITYKGYKTTDEQTTSFQVYYKWTDDQTLSQPAATYPYAAEDNGMTNLINEDHTWAKVGSSSEMGDMIVLDFTENPITYESGKSLVVYMHSYVDGYKAANFEKSTLSQDFCYARKADAATLSSAFSKQVPAALHFTLEASTNTFAGTVKDKEGNAIENAIITLVSYDGDNVQYTGMTEADGTFSINVIQATREYSVNVTAENYVPVVDYVKFDGQSIMNNYVVKQDVSNAIANADFEGDYSVYASPKDDRDIYQPNGWTVVYENGDINDMTALNSSSKAWSNFSSRPQLAEGGNNTYWVRFRWGNSEHLNLSQTVSLPAGEYRMTADAFFNGADGASATISAAGVSTSIAGNSTWKNYSVDFTLTEKTNVTFAIDLKQKNAIENIAAFDNFKLNYLSEFAREALIAEIAKAESYKDGRAEGLTDYEAAIATAKGFLTSEDTDAINDAIEALQNAEITFMLANQTETEYASEGYSNDGATRTVYNVLGENIVKNGAFEYSDPISPFYGWTTGNDAAMSADNFNLVTEDGNHYIKAKGHTGAGGENSIKTGWSIEAGKTYVFGYKVKAEDAGNSEFHVVSLTNELGTETQKISKTETAVGTDWTDVRYFFTNPNTDGYAYVQFCARWLNSAVCFDDFYLAEAEYHIEGNVDYAKDAIPTANIGDDAFQYSQDAIDAANALVQGTASVEDVEAAYEAVTTLNVPAETQAYNIVFNCEGHSATGNALTLIPNPAQTQGLYGLKYLAPANVNLAQAFYFTHTTGNKYKIHAIDTDGNQRYITTQAEGYGTSWYEGIRTIDDATKAMEVEIRPNGEGLYLMWNTGANKPLGHNGNSNNDLFTNNTANFQFIETTKPSITINTSAAGWGTVMLPFAAELPEGVTAYTCAAAEGNTLTLVEVENGALEANKPYIIKGSWEETVTGDALGTAETYTVGLLTGTYVDMSADDGTYVLQKQDEKVGFYLVDINVATPWVRANHAYLTAPTGARYAAFFFDGEATGINAVNALTSGDAQIFNANGVMTNKLKKGMNIIRANGKTVKVMVK